MGSKARRRSIVHHVIETHPGQTGEQLMQMGLLVPSDAEHLFQLELDDYIAYIYERDVVTSGQQPGWYVKIATVEKGGDVVSEAEKAWANELARNENAPST